MILVTGAAGFLGSRLVPLLRHKGHEVTPLTRGTGPSLSQAEWRADLLDPAHIDLLAAARAQVETIVHLAGVIEIALTPGPDGRPVPGPERLWNIYAGNVAATANVLRLAEALGARHVVFASSQAVYGQPEMESVDENSLCHPLEHYAASKLACEEMLRLASLRGLGVTALRFPGLYGAGRLAGTVRRFCRAALAGGPVVVDAAFTLPFDVLHVDDAAQGFARACERPAQGWRRLNLSTGEPCSLEILARDVAALVPGCEVELRGVAQRSLTLDCSRARTEIGWAPGTRRERLRQTLEEVRTTEAGINHA